MEEINAIKEQLKSENAEVRRVGVEKIAERPSQETLDFLFEAIGDEDWRVRKTAAESLVYFNTLEGFYKRVFSALESDENAGKRNSAVEIISKVGDKAVSNITDFLPQANFEVKKLLIDALGDIKNVSSANVIANFLDDPDENVRAAAAETLGKIKSKASVDHLVKVLQKDDMQLQFCALEALEKIEEPVKIDAVIPLLEKKILRKAAFEVLGKSREIDAIKYLIDGLNESSKSTREAAIKGIVNIYNSMSEEIKKEEILNNLQKESSEDLLKRLIASLVSPYDNVKMSAIKLLGFLKAIKTIPNILDVHGEDELEKCKFEAVVSMGKDTYDVIKKEFVSRNDIDRVFLAQIMGVLKDERYEEFLTGSLDDNFGHMRSASALALAELRKVKSISQIFPHLNDHYKDVQVASLEALTTLGMLYPREIREEIEANLIADDDQFKISIISLIGRIGIKEDIKHLDMALRYGNPDVRTSAVYAIGEINVLEESNHLIMALTDESDNVRIATAKTLGLLYSEDSVRALIRALEDENTWVQINAMRSLAKLNATKAAEAITKFLMNKNPLLVINAIESLKELNASKLKYHLSELLHHDDPEIIKATIAVLKEELDDNSLNEILDLLNTGAPDVRILVYKSLEDVKDESIVQKVLPFIEKEEDEVIQRMARRILGV